MSKENKNKDMLVRVQPSLFEKFQNACENNYRTLSDVIREFMLDYVRKHGDKND